MFTKQCDRCGIEFQAQGSRALWCGDACRSAALALRRKLEYRDSAEYRKARIEKARATHRRLMASSADYRRYRKLVGKLTNARASLRFHQEKVNERIQAIVQITKAIERAKDRKRIREGAKSAGKK